MAQRKEHIIMFPFMAQGHLIPFFALALRIEEKKGYKITFINTPLNIKKLRTSIPPGSSIDLLEIPFNSTDHGLPPNTENTDSVHYDLVFTLLEASLSLKPYFRNAICDLVSQKQGEKPPLCIIADMFFGWSAEIAREFDIFHAIFCSGGGFGFACYYSLWVNLPHCKANSDLFTMPDFPLATKIHVTQLGDHLRKADGSDPQSKCQRKVLPQIANCDAILVNTVEEIDRLGLMYFRRKFGLPVWPIGPVLLSSGSQARAGKEAGIVPEMCKNWLDTKPPNSVLYVSFGSQNTVSAPNIMELAMALEATGKNFIWVVRPPLGCDINSEFRTKEWLPEGFEERIESSGRGLLVHKWAPQVEILSHNSVAVFLSHCGWNSVLEALNHGKPILGWPLAADQFYNAKILEEEIGVCVEVARGKIGGIKCEEIVKKIESVMGETEKGKEMKRKSCEVQGILKEAIKDDGEGFKGSSVKAMEEFLDAALLMRKGKEGPST